MKFIDMLGNEVTVPELPKRIVSLVPSQTELLFDLGLDKAIVGITRYCIHPDTQTKTKTIISGIKKFRFDVIDKLEPDLIIANKEENYLEGIKKLQQKYSVWISDVNDLSQAYVMIKDIGVITNKTQAAQASFVNRFAEYTRYPQTTIAELQSLKPEVLMLSSEPFPFTDKHVEEMQQQLPQTRVLLVDGSMFSWYGSRLQYASDYFKKLREKIFQ